MGRCERKGGSNGSGGGRQRIAVHNDVRVLGTIEVDKGPGAGVDVRRVGRVRQAVDGAVRMARVGLEREGAVDGRVLELITNY